MTDFSELSLLERLQVMIDSVRYIGPENATLIEAKAEIERLQADFATYVSFPSIK